MVRFAGNHTGADDQGEPVSTADANVPRADKQASELASEQEARLDAWLALTGQVPAPAAPVELPLLTGSMVPAIPVGASLRITMSPTAPCRVGDVIVFLQDNRLIAHRILLVLRAGPWSWLLEKGDANPLGRWRRDADVRGRVVGFCVAGQPPQDDPTDSTLASTGLRRHIKQWLFTLGGRRAANLNE